MWRTDRPPRIHVYFTTPGHLGKKQDALFFIALTVWRLMNAHKTGFEPEIHKCMCFAESVFIFIIKFFSILKLAREGFEPSTPCV